MMEYLVSARMADPKGVRRMERRIEELRGHVIVAGLGRVGRQVAQELAAAGRSFVVVAPSGRRRRQFLLLAAARARYNPRTPCARGV